MALFNLTDLLASLGRDQRVIGIDPGARTIGLALSDVRRTLASPYGRLKRAKLMANATQIAAMACCWRPFLSQIPQTREMVPKKPVASATSGMKTR